MSWIFWLWATGLSLWVGTSVAVDTPAVAKLAGLAELLLWLPVATAAVSLPYVGQVRRGVPEESRVRGFIPHLA
jgi:hypothetical protein